jgi:hypothetical protein
MESGAFLWPLAVTNLTLPPSVPIPPKSSNPEQSGLAYDVQPGRQVHKIELN